MILLKTLTRKSTIETAKYVGLTVQKLFDLKKQSYLVWMYYYNQKITFTDDVLTELKIKGDLKIQKPGIDKEKHREFYLNTKNRKKKPKKHWGLKRKSYNAVLPARSMQAINQGHSGVNRSSLIYQTYKIDKPPSAETKKALIKSNKDRVSRVIQFDEDFNQIAEYKSAEEAAGKTGLPKNSIYSACTKKHKLEGFYWRYERYLFQHFN